MHSRRALPLAAGALTALLACGAPEPIVEDSAPRPEVPLTEADSSASEAEAPRTAAVPAAALDPDAWFARVRWEHRLLVLHGPAEEVAGQLEALRALEPELLERDLLVIDASASEARVVLGPPGAVPAGRDLRERCGLDGEGFEAALVGLDGGVKIRRYARFDPREVLRVIDAMPMRRAELRGR